MFLENEHPQNLMNLELLFYSKLIHSTFLDYYILLLRYLLQKRQFNNLPLVFRGFKTQQLTKWYVFSTL